MKSAEPIKFSLKVLLIKENNYWVAQCLDYDIAAQGKTLNETKSSFEKVFLGHVLLDLRDGIVPLSEIPRAPSRYVEMFYEGAQLKDKQKFTVPQEDLIPGYIIDAEADDLRLCATC